jgi:hypothetical protein
MHPERRGGDRRRAERRQAPRSGPDRRKGDRRGLGWGAGLLAGAVLVGAPARSSAQIYTRTNAQGVLEATDVPTRPHEYRLAYPKRLGVLIHSSAFRLHAPAKNAFDEHIDAAAALYQVSSDLVRAVIQTESAFDHLAVSSVGAQGLMQLMPATARRFGVANPFDPRQNIFGGVRYLRVLLNMFDGDVVRATAAYNAGETAVRRHGGVPPYKETLGYVRKIQALLTGAGPEVAQASLSASAAQPVNAAASRPQPRTLYRWLDANGVVHVGDTPPPDLAYTTLRSTD